MKVKNIGERAGHEVLQIYASAAGFEAPKRLVGWSKIKLLPGEAREVEIQMPARHFAIYDTGWRIMEGKYDLFLGESSRRLPLKASLKFARVENPSW